MKLFRAGGRDDSHTREMRVLRTLKGDRWIESIAAHADGPPLSPDERALVIEIYGEVLATWRDLHGVRFRLLGLLPLATLGVLALGLKTGATAMESWLAVTVTLLGLLVTIGLWIYDTRNSELYDDLISRGRRMEAELGLSAGVFLQRPRNKWPLVNHGTATGLIYLAVGLAWLAGLVLAAHQLCTVRGMAAEVSVSPLAAPSGPTP